MSDSERDKMLRGDLYRADDPQLMAARSRARRLWSEFNRTDPADHPGRASLLGKLLGRIGRKDEALQQFTAAANLGPVCRHDHRVKHHGGWRLHQPRPGHFTWTSPLGHTYQVPPSVIIEALPDPIDPRPHHDPLWTRSDHGWQTSHLLPPPPPTPEPARPPPPPPDDDLPPF